MAAASTEEMVALLREQGLKGVVFDFDCTITIKHSGSGMAHGVYNVCAIRLSVCVCVYFKRCCGAPASLPVLCMYVTVTVTVTGYLF